MHAIGVKSINLACVIVRYEEVVVAIEGNSCRAGHIGGERGIGGTGDSAVVDEFINFAVGGTRDQKVAPAVKGQPHEVPGVLAKGDLGTPR